MNKLLKILGVGAAIAFVLFLFVVENYIAAVLSVIGLIYLGKKEERVELIQGIHDH